MLATVLALAALAWLALAPTAAAQDDWSTVARDAEHSASADGPAPPYREAWSSDVPSNPIAGPVVADETVVVVGAASVVALDASSGDVIWERGRAEGSAGPALIAGDVVVHANGKGDTASLVGRSLETGRQAWLAFVGGAVVGGPALAGDLVVAGTRAGTVVGVNAESGDEEWEYEIAGRVDTSPAVWEDTVVVVADDLEAGTSTVVALDAATGEESWRFAPQGVSVGSSSVSVADGLVFVGMGDGRIRALDVESGAERWGAQAFAGRQAFRSRQVPAAYGEVLVPDLIVLHLLDAETGEERWTYRLTDLLDLSSPAAIGSWAVLGDGDGRAAAIDLASGRLVWERDIGPGPVGAPASDGERLYLTSRARDDEGGGVVALENDPEGTLLDEPSPTALFVLPALGSFALAFLLVGGGILLLFRYLVPERRGDDAEDEA